MIYTLVCVMLMLNYTKKHFELNNKIIKFA